MTFVVVSSRALIFALLALSVSHPAANADISATDWRGKTITLPAYPQRIVSLSPGTTEILFAIGLKGRIVGATAYCDYPEEAKSVSRVGDVTISAEKVIARRPDLVVASGSANRTAIQTLERLRLKVFAVDPSTFDETYRAIAMLGAITGQSRQAGRVVEEMKRGVRSAQSSIPAGLKRPKTLWIVQADPLIVVGAKSFMDDLITLSGAENVGRSAGTGWPTMSPEKLIYLKPEVIFSGRETGAQVKRRPAWRNVPAIALGRVHSLGTFEAVRPGPRLVIALKKMIDIIHRNGPAARR